MTKPMIIGLTGSIGMGKSTVAEMFEALGIPVFDADAQVRAMQGPGGSVLPAIEAAFPGTTGPDGVDRNELGRRVFGDAAALARLESIMHPAVAERRAAFLAANTGSPMLVFDIPLLFEKGGAASVDRIVVVSAPADIQRDRVLSRPGMTEEKFAQILKLQTPDPDKRAQADHVIDTGQTIERTQEDVADLVTRLKGEAAQQT